MRASRRAWGVATVAALTTVAFGLWSSLTRPDPAAAGPTVAYLPDPGRPGLRSETARAAGMQVAASVTDFLRLADRADAVVVDRARLGDLPADFLADQYRRGRVVAGINVPMADLERLTGGWQPTPPGDFRQDWGERPFYSVVYQSAATDGMQNKGWVSDQLNGPTVLMWVIRTSVRDAQGNTDS
jgi:hypothetical protein